MHQVLLIVHLLGASIWVGGHLLLAISYLPKALKRKEPDIIKQFEQNYEKLGLPALAALVVTGVWMSFDYGVRPAHWFGFDSPIETVVSAKLLLLAVTVLLAIYTRLLVIPRLSDRNLSRLAWPIYAVTAGGISMLVLGTFVRFGGI